MADDNLVYSSSIWAANTTSIWATNATTFNRTAQIYSKEQEQAAIYVVVVVMVYACSIFGLLTLVLCKKKPHITHADRDVDRFLRDIESVRVALRRRDQKFKVNKFIRGISTPGGELARTHSMDVYLESDSVRKVRPPLRRATSERVRAVHFDDVPAHLVPAGSFEAVSSDSETSLSPLIQTMAVHPPSYEELKLKSFGGFTDTTHCQSCTCHLHMGHQNHFVPAPATPPGTEVALVHRPVSAGLPNLAGGDRNQSSLPNFSYSSPVSQYSGRPMLHASSGPTRIPRPVIRATMARMPFIDENEEHTSNSLRRETGPSESKTLQFSGGQRDLKGCVSPGETLKGRGGKTENVLRPRQENGSNRNQLKQDMDSTEDEPAVTAPLIATTAL